MWMNPKGQLWGNAGERRRDLDGPYLEGFLRHQDYLRELKKLGWMVVKVEFRELRAK